jgi:hypothetical protein
MEVNKKEKEIGSKKQTNGTTDTSNSDVKHDKYISGERGGGTPRDTTNDACSCFLVILLLH